MGVSALEWCAPRSTSRAGAGAGAGAGTGTGAGAAFAGLPGGGCLLPTLFCAGRDGAVRELSVAGEVLATMRSPAGQPVLCLAVRTEKGSGRTEVIAAGGGGFLSVWEWADQMADQAFEEGSGAAAVGCRLLHCAEGSLHGDAGDVSALSLDPATSCLVTGSKEGIRVWKAGVV